MKYYYGEFNKNISVGNKPVSNHSLTAVNWFWNIFDAHRVGLLFKSKENHIASRTVALIIKETLLSISIEKLHSEAAGIINCYAVRHLGCYAWIILDVISSLHVFLIIMILGAGHFNIRQGASLYDLTKFWRRDICIQNYLIALIFHRRVC